MEERSFILKYRQATPRGQEMARQKLREEADRAERNGSHVRVDGRKNQ